MVQYGRVGWRLPITNNARAPGKNQFNRELEIIFAAFRRFHFMIKIAQARSTDSFNFPNN